MPKPLVLYSVNSFLAFAINQRFYNRMHYVWCCPIFDKFDTDAVSSLVARSSLPSEIFSEYSKDVESNDLHSAKIKENKIGLINGVEAKLKAGVINNSKADEIRAIIDIAEISMFRPLVYVIPYEKVESDIIEVPVHSRAGLFSPELKLENLKRTSFDVFNSNLLR